MALPSIELADSLASVVSDDWSVIAGPVSSVQANALVIRPDTPWIQPSAFCHDLQGYAGIAAVPAASGLDGAADIHRLIIDIMDNLPEGWRFVQANGTGLDQSTGTPLLTAMIKLEYTNSEQEAS